jgi:chaperone modulatory protein CbpM
MKTLEEVLELLDATIDRATVERYIAHEWLRPVAHNSVWYFEEIDIARIELVYHLTQDIQVNDHGMDVVLSLIDQLYGMRAQMQSLLHTKVTFDGRRAE